MLLCDKLKRCQTPTEKNIILILEVLRLRGLETINISSLSRQLCVSKFTLYGVVGNLEERNLILTLKNGKIREVLL